MRRRSRYVGRPARQRHSRAFTLIELLVALLLSVLVLQLILPLLSAAKRGSVGESQENPSVETWRSVLQSDLSSLVSQAKCGVTTARIDRSRQSSAFDRLELQTMSRPGDGSFGPLEARYVIEPLERGQALGLVRYGQGWHDGSRTRHVLIENVTGWHLKTLSGQFTAASQPTTKPSARTSFGSDALQVTLQRADGNEQQVLFWTGTGIEVE